ncbi:metallophosphoesterase family protein [Carboxylicivirga sp. N1Y90]|uniref:metallophosphoesterase family protein n=1 Tax=Carboxylicivirga fragile TaxID=3417571 RepID=UPI003D328203|nr:hypothetical protein [Marinilabiliaceae bacterium N1Y90]
MRFIIYLISILSLIGCEKDLTENAFVKKKTYTSTQNIINYNRLVKKSKTEFKPFKLALWSNHEGNNNLLRAHMSSVFKVDFGIHLGDFTASAEQSEYEGYIEACKQWEPPIMTVKGELDGGELFENYFGSSSFSFEYNTCKFIVLDNTTETQDLEWFRKELECDDSNVYTIVLSHLVSKETFDEEVWNNYDELIRSNNVDLVIHGYESDFIQSVDSKVLIVPPAYHQQIAILNFTESGIQIQHSSI